MGCVARTIARDDPAQDGPELMKGRFAILWILLAVSATSCGSTHRAGSLVLQLKWSVKLDANDDASPIITRQGNGKVVLVLAGNNDHDCEPPALVQRSTLYALKADTGKLLWEQSTRGRSRCTTSSPAVWHGWVFSPGLDGFIHRYSLRNGKEYRRQGWPKRFALDPWFEKASSPLRIFGHYLYVTTSGYTGHPGKYRGHLVTINLQSGEARVWNSLCSRIHHLLGRNGCSQSGSGIWSRAGPEQDSGNGGIIIATGDGPWNGTTNFGDSILEFPPNGSHPLGGFTPTNQAFLDEHDLDLGSSSPMLLPGGAFAIEGGKGPAGSDGGPTSLELLSTKDWRRRSSLHSISQPLATVEAPGGCSILTALSMASGSKDSADVIVANDCALEDYRVSGLETSHPSIEVRWRVRGKHFTTPVVSGGDIYVARSGALAAFELSTGKLLWTTKNLGHAGAIGNVHWEYPAISGSMVFMTDERGRLYAYQRRG
jgi:outer membrane protein assembly factor BamB